MHPLLKKILDPPLIPIPLIFFDQPILKLKGNKNALKHENISLAPGSRNVCQNKSVEQLRENGCLPFQKFPEVHRVYKYNQETMR